MKTNQKFAKHLIIASITTGIIGFSSIFNDSQATGFCWGTATSSHGITTCGGIPSNCTYRCA